MKLTIMQDGEITAELELTEKARLIGSADGCDIQIEDAKVAARHAQLFLQGQECYIGDVEGTTGTYVNDLKISQSVALKSLDTIRVGGFQFQILIADEQAIEHVPSDSSKESNKDNVAASSVKLGKGLFNLAKAASREAGRGAKLAALKTHLEKLKHIDLSRSLADLGAQAYEIKWLPGEYEAIYREISAIDEELRNKRAQEAVSDDQSYTQKTKAKIIDLKNKAQAEALEIKRRNKCEEFGRLILKTGGEIPHLETRIQNVRVVESQIDSLQNEFEQRAGDKSGYADLVSASKGIGVATMSATLGIGAATVSATRLPIWKKPVAWAAIFVLAITFVIFTKINKSTSSANVRSSPTKQSYALDKTEYDRLWSVGYQRGIEFTAQELIEMLTNPDGFTEQMRRDGIDFSSSDELAKARRDAYQKGYDTGAKVNAQQQQILNSIAKEGTKTREAAQASATTRGIVVDVPRATYQQDNTSAMQAMEQNRQALLKVEEDKIRQNEAASKRRMLQAEISGLEAEIRGLQMEISAARAAGNHDLISSKSSICDAKSSLLTMKKVQLSQLYQ